MRAGPARHPGGYGGAPAVAGKPPGRSLERRSNAPPRGMIVLDRIRLTGRLHGTAPPDLIKIRRRRGFFRSWRDHGAILAQSRGEPSPWRTIPPSANKTRAGAIAGRAPLRTGQQRDRRRAIAGTRPEPGGKDGSNMAGAWPEHGRNMAGTWIEGSSNVP